jgi:HAD superfamily phosphatase (TIGR01668 family)
MALYKPTMYKKNIFEIDYDKLKKNGIKCLVFDLDNTLGLIDEKECPKEAKKLLKKLKKDFTIYISSNNTRKRILPYIEDLEIEGESFSLKPLPKGLIRIRKRCGFKKSEMVMIGDQMVTDILSGNLYGVKTILVDPLGVKDLKITGLNRKIEGIIVKNYERRGIFKKGSYYE